MLVASILLTQDLLHTIEMADLITRVQEMAIEWADEFPKESVDLEGFRRAAFDRGCNVLDGEDGCLLKCDDCEPTPFEQEALVAAYVWAAIQYVTAHAVVKKA